MRTKSLFMSIMVMMIVSSANICAQKISYSNSNAKQSKYNFSKVIGQTAQGFFVLRSNNGFDSFTEQVHLRSGSKVSISYTDKSNLIEKWATELKLPAYDSEIQHVCFFNGVIYVFYVAYNRDTENNDLLYVKIDAKTGIVNLSPMKVDEQSSKRKYLGDYFISTSVNEKYISLNYKAPDVNNDNYLKFTLQLLDTGMHIVWNKEVPTNYESKNFYLKNQKIDDNGNIFLLCANRTKNNPNRPTSFSIMHTGKNVAALSEFPVELYDKYITDVLIDFDGKQQKLLYSGFYSVQSGISSAGIICGSINIASSSVNAAKVIPFKPKFLNQISSQSSLGKGGELLNYYVDRIVPRSDGGLVLLAESSFVTESSVYNAYYQMYTTIYDYHFENVITFSVSPEGEIEWEAVMRKNQESENDNAFYSSYSVLIDKSKLYYFYNKSIRRRTDVMCYSVDTEGKSEEKIIASGNDDVLIMPKSCKQIFENELLLPCLQKGKVAFLKAEIE